MSSGSLTAIVGVDASGTVSANLFTPDAADGADIGSVDLEFSDLYLGASGVIYGELNQAASITSSSTGWTFNTDITVSGGNINTGAVALVVGDASTTSIQLLTDATGEGEVELPNDSIGDEEIDWSDVTGVDITLTDCAAITSTSTITSSGIFDVTGAAAMTLGSADVTSMSILTTGATTIYDANNDGSPTFHIGSSAAESLQVTATYEAGGQLIEKLTFETKTEDTDAHDGEIEFKIDEALELTITDDGLTVAGDILLSGGNFNTGATALTIGDGTTTSITIDTDGTGDAEIVLENDSIGPDEIDSTTGVYDFGGVTSFEIPNSSGPTTDTTGEIGFDTDGDGDEFATGVVVISTNGATKDTLSQLPLFLATLKTTRF